MKYMVADWKQKVVLIKTNSRSEARSAAYKRIDDTDGDCDVVVYERVLDRWIPLTTF